MLYSNNFLRNWPSFILYELDFLTRGCFTSFAVMDFREVAYSLVTSLLTDLMYDLYKKLAD